ncbi:hypothetical protein [Ochrovirga pacifica]|uniref:hypothetical protein n=1 Tax=Ochrovirga pacifica TaxID=1042376 RepID=UPI000680A076|nr:hypothetical protein [Ochrovirga pacifica]
MKKTMKLIYKKKSFYFLAFLTLVNCATYKKQISDSHQNWQKIQPKSKTKAHHIYLIGDAGNSPQSNQNLQNLAQELQEEKKTQPLFFWVIIFIQEACIPIIRKNKKTELKD